MKSRLVLISDTHGRHEDLGVLPGGDILIHAGDFTDDIGRASLRKFLTWFQKQPHEHKIFIAGNHDGAFQKWPVLAKAMMLEVAPGCTYLEDNMIYIRDLLFYGSPYTPTFGSWYFMKDKGPDMKSHWSKVSDMTDVLITHGPGDMLCLTNQNEFAGCNELAERVCEVKPMLHVFGHIHRSYGIARRCMIDVNTKLQDEVISVNAASCGEDYKICRKPIVVDLDK